MTQNEINNGLGQLVSRLKKEDAGYARKVRRILIYWGIYFLIRSFLVIPDSVENKNIYELISELIYVFSFLIIVLSYIRICKIHKNVNYSLPTILMLKEVVERYHPFSILTIWNVIAVIMVDVAFTLGEIDHFSILKSQLIFSGLVLVVATVSLIYWHIKYKPISNAALKLIKEIEGE